MKKEGFMTEIKIYLRQNETSNKEIERLLYSAPDFEIIKSGADIDGKDWIRFKAYGIEWVKRHRWVDKGLGVGYYFIEMDSLRKYKNLNIKTEKINKNIWKHTWQYGKYNIEVISDWTK